MKYQESFYLFHVPCDNAVLLNGDKPFNLDVLRLLTLTDYETLNFIQRL